MISAIFNEFIKNKKGAVEIIESSLIFSFIMLFMSFLFLLSMLTINKAIAKESEYFKARSNLIEITSRSVEANLENKKEDNLEIIDGIFINKINYYSQNGKVRQHSTSKYKNHENIRLLDFGRYVYDDLDDKHQISSKINEIFSKLKENSIKFEEKVNEKKS